MRREVKCPICNERGWVWLDKKPYGTYIRVTHPGGKQHHVGPSAELLRKRARRLREEVERVSEVEPEAREALSELIDAELVKNYGARSLDEALALASEFLAQALELAEAKKDLERVTGELEEWRAEVSRRLEGK